MKIVNTDIEGVILIEPDVFGDSRGYFMESWNQAEFDKHVGKVRFVQDNESFSTYGVLRGLHFQRDSAAQAKLVRVIEGRVLDVAVDLRKGSPTFGQYVSVELTGENHLQLYIPKGFAHGFAVLSPVARFLYKCDSPYAPQMEAGIAWNDPQIGIDWGLPAEDIRLSDKDLKHKCLRDIPEDWLFDS